jgi:hypothetical protein
MSYDKLLTRIVALLRKADTIDNPQQARPALQVAALAACRDCGVDTLPTQHPDRAQWYVVHESVWASTGLGPNDGALCLGCLEARIGRALTADDFTDARMNDHAVKDVERYAWSWRTPKLQALLEAR